MTIGISSPSFSLVEFEAILEPIARHFAVWELIAEYKHSLPAIKDEVRDAMNCYDMKFAVHAPFSDLNIGSVITEASQLAFQQLTAAIETTAALCLELVTFHPGHLSPLGLFMPEQVKALNKDAVRRLDKIADEHGITLALENMPKWSVALCYEARALVDAIEGTGVKLCFDLGHANTAGQIDELLGYKHLFANVHLHDNNGDKDAHLVIGEGNIPFEKLLRELNASYNGDHIIECRKLDEGLRSKAALERMLDGL